MRDYKLIIILKVNMVYKVDLSVYATQIQNLNNSWIEQYRANNPQDTVTQRYVEEFTWFGFGYVVKDAVTEQYITNFVELVNELPTRWHEEKSNQIIQNKSGVIWGAMNEPDIAFGLASYRKTNNITTYDEGDKLYFYVNTILPEHQAIFDTYPQFEITINNINI
jgi:hypothetical protein